MNKSWMGSCLGEERLEKVKTPDTMSESTAGGRSSNNANKSVIMSTGALADFVN